jgi:pimeloyl-ACP methyl ester carboxylesterase
MARTSVRRQDTGSFTTHYDPKITVQFTASPEDFRSWDRFSRINLPLHLIAGGTSDILPPAIIQRMQAMQPGMGVTLFDAFGHAPSLSRDPDIALVRSVIAGLSRA